MSADKQQSRKFFSCTAIMLLILLLSALWVWYQLRVFVPILSTQFQMMALFTAAMVLTILIILRQLAFDAVQRIEALIDKQYQTEDAFRICFNPGFTTKQTHEGIGLTTVMRLVNPLSRRGVHGI